MRNRAIAKTWVEKNKINKQLDKDADQYVDRVLKLLVAGESDRTTLRSLRSNSEKNSGLDPTSVATEARLYYQRVTKQVEQRPKKILDHRAFKSLGLYYFCLWSDVGYGGQNIQEWKPKDCVMQFDGLLEDYRQVA